VKFALQVFQYLGEILQIGHAASVNACDDVAEAVVVSGGAGVGEEADEYDGLVLPLVGCVLQFG
jgi:hypothetical protein